MGLQDPCLVDGKGLICSSIDELAIYSQFWHRKLSKWGSAAANHSEGAGSGRGYRRTVRFSRYAKTQEKPCRKRHTYKAVSAAIACIHPRGVRDQLQRTKMSIIGFLYVFFFLMILQNLKIKKRLGFGSWQFVFVSKLVSLVAIYTLIICFLCSFFCLVFILCV